MILLRIVFMNKILYVPHTVYLHITLKTKKKQTLNVLNLLYETIAPTHKEQGCLEYKILQEGRFITLFGKWENKMVLNMHLLFAYHIKLFEETLPPLCKTIDTKIFEEIEPPITALSVANG